MRVTCLATCALNQWALDFEGNLARVKASIWQAKAKGARYRVGPELELPGYGCEDHVLEVDTVEHSWECLAQLLAGDDTDDILCDVGMPVIHGGVRYNCRVFVLNREILLIRPKLCLATMATTGKRAGSQRGSTRRKWKIQAASLISDVTKQTHVLFGDAALEFMDGSLGSETCEELFTPNAPLFSSR